MTQQIEPPGERGIRPTLPWFGRRTRAAEREVEMLRALLGSVPLAYAAFGPDAPLVAPDFPARFGLATVTGPADLVAALPAEEGARLQAALAALAQDATPFQMTVRPLAPSGTALALTGQVVGGNGAGRTLVLWARDVSDEVARQAALTEAAEQQSRNLRRLSRVLDRLPGPVWLRDAGLGLAWVNEAYARAVELPPDRAVSEARELAPTALDRTGRGLAERVRVSGRVADERRHVVIGGRRRLLRLVEMPLGLDGLQLGFATDDTELEEAQADLTRHVQAHGQVLEQLHSAVGIFGPDTRLTFHNAGFEHLWKLDPAWLASRPTMAELLEKLRELRALPEEADFRRFKQQRLAMFQSLIEPAEELWHRSDGTALRLLTVPHPLGGLLMAAEDVTSRLELESSYNTLIAVQRETLDNLNEGIAVIGPDGRVQLFNPAFCDIWRVEAVVLERRPHISAIVELQRPLWTGDEAAWPELRTLLVGRMLDREERVERIRLSDGRTLDTAYVPLPDGGVLTTALDVSDSVRVEEALRERSDALEAAERLKADFLANVSYQLRTPLNAIVGFGEILLNQYFGPLTAKQQEYTQGLLQASHRLTQLIDAILDLSTIEAGYLTLAREPVDTGAVIADVFAVTQDWARKQQIEMEVECGDEGLVIEGDEQRLKQVLLNLVSNAIKATQAGGRIRLCARRLDGHVRLEVADSGVGIRPEDLGRVFEPFERARSKGFQAGAGVGLALVKRFVEMHGGRVEVASIPDQGTTITCVLPVERPRGPDSWESEPAG